MFVLRSALRFVQTHYNVGDPSKHFCLLRCLDIVSPAMLIQRQRSSLEIGIKTICLGILLVHSVGLVYDFCHQRDIRAAMDIFSMMSLFMCILMRSMSLKNFQSDITAMERLDANPRFRVGWPFADAIRQEVVHKDNLYLGMAMVSYFFSATIYVLQNLATQNSFVTLVTYWPADLSSVAPTLDKLAQVGYSLFAYGWGWCHAAGQITIIVLLRMGIAEFRVFLHSLATLDQQIAAAQEDSPGSSRERVVCDLLYEHARRHRELIVVMMRLRAMLRVYTLVHFSFYMMIMAAFMTRIIIITGKSSLGMAIPLLVSAIFFFETLGMCLLVEKLIQLNRKVSFALYSFEWPQCLPFGSAIKRPMLLMIMQASNTRDFSAGGLTMVSAELFAKSCRLVYTIMMCMANLTNAGA